jgi:hypothetical protein
MLLRNQLGVLEESAAKVQANQKNKRHSKSYQKC